ncbi:solute carrier family 23 protein [Candidatus Poriferisocius sp.]|uniref:solute carrier family 23 protein n=1 Tax=Candidatus Poriferisocius sp. TaxID=3101276 RepID=UPI003B518BCF
MNEAIRYEPNDPCPPLVAIAVGAQGVMANLLSIVLVVAITARAGGQDDSYLSWALFAALIISGALTVLQGTRIGRFGAGHVLLMGVTANFVAISVLALNEGGPSLLASLVVVSSFFYLLLSLWLPLLRRIITPVVSGTVMMLIAATVLPIALDRVPEVPESSPEAAGPVIALVTLVATVVLALKVTGAWRLWSPLIGLGAGCIAAAFFGAFDFDRVVQEPWFGVPDGGLPGFDLTPGAGFWALLPVFAVVTIVGGIKNISDSVAIQQASWRRPRVTDFRLVQGSLNTNGLGIFFSGLAGTPPSTVYSTKSVQLTTLTGVAARSVGFAAGALFALLAFFPKLAAALAVIPSPVMGAYILSAIGMLFVGGIQTVTSDGLDARKALVVGVAFSLGVGLENQTIFAGLLGETWGVLFDNGVLVGAVVAVVLTVFLDLTSPHRPTRLTADLDLSSLGEIDEFLRRLASKIVWDEVSARRLRSAGEETLMSLLESEELESREDTPRLIIQARPDAQMVELEFLAVFDDENLEDRLAYLSEEAEGAEEGEVSLRLLRHYSSSVHHQKYHGLDIVTVQVRGSG